MATQIEMVQQRVEALEAKFGKDDPFAKLLRQQLVGMELSQHNKNERFLMSTGRPETSGDPQTEMETEQDAIQAEAIRREKVRRVAQEASKRFPATPTETSKARQDRTRK